MNIVKTSISLLNAIANDTSTVRWTEFFLKYEMVMRNYLNKHFPFLDHDDIIQETMRSLVAKLPDYHYTPDKNGHFSAYLIGIIRHKALDQLRKQTRIVEITRRAAENLPDTIEEDKFPEEEKWKEQAVEAALEQLLANTSINQRNREIFRHVVLLHEPPEEVAQQFGISRGNVDVIKKRMIEKLSAIATSMTELISP